MRIHVVPLLAVFGLCLLPSASQADVPVPARLIYLSNSDARSLGLTATVGPWTDYPSVSGSTNVSPSSLLADWNVDLELDLPAPWNSELQVNHGIFAHSTHNSTFAEQSISTSITAFAGAWGNGGFSVPGWAEAVAGFGIGFQVTAEVDYELDVWISGPWPSPFSLESSSSGVLASIPGYPYTGHFTFSGTFKPGEVYSLAAQAHSSGNSGNIDDAGVRFALVIPEPTTVALLGLGSLAWAMVRRRRGHA
jgi:hypothetical protein